LALYEGDLPLFIIAVFIAMVLSIVVPLASNYI